MAPSLLPQTDFHFPIASCQPWVLSAYCEQPDTSSQAVIFYGLLVVDNSTEIPRRDVPKSNICGVGTSLVLEQSSFRNL